MVSTNIRSLNPSRNRTWQGNVVEKGILFLLVFTPLAFGSVQVWASSVMEIAAFIIFGAWLLRKRSGIETGFMDAGRGAGVMLVIFGAFVALIIAQITPLPAWLLRILSPNTAAFYDRYTINGSAEWRTLSIYQWATRQELLRLLSYAAVFLVIVNHYRTHEKTEALVRKIILIALSLVVFAIVQKLTWNGMMFWIYPLDERVSSSRGFSVWGPFLNRNHFAGYLEMCIPLGLGMILYGTAKTRTSRNAAMPKRIASVMSSNWFLSLGLWSVATLVLTGALFMTLSRGGIIGFLCSALFLFILARTRRGLRKKIIFPVFAGFLLILTLGAAGWELIEDRFEKVGEESSLRRADVWADAAGIVKDYPLLGTGLGTFQSSYPRYQSHSATIIFDHAHNDYVELLTDTGLAGFILGSSLVVIFFGVLLVIWMKRHSTYVKTVGAGSMASLVAIAVHGFTDFNLHIPANAMLFAVIAGIAYSVIMNKEEHSDIKMHES